MAVGVGIFPRLVVFPRFKDYWITVIGYTDSLKVRRRRKKGEGGREKGGGRLCVC